MFNNAFGEILFDTGWKTKTEIVLWENTYSIKVKARSYYEEDGITAEQESAYMEFKTLKAEKQRIIESMLSQFYKNERNADQLRKQLTPTMLVIERDGAYALLFDDEDDLDNGLAAVLSPEEKVLTQDEYL